MSADFTQPELPSMGIISPLGDDDRRLLSSYGEFLPAQPGVTIIEEGQEQNFLYFIISGLLHATVQRAGRSTLLGRIRPGETLGEVNIFSGGTASASVAAVEYSQVWRIDLGSLEDYINVHPTPAAHLLIGIATTLSKRLRDTNDRLATVTSTSTI